MGDKYPRESAFDRGFEVFSEAAAAAEPSEGTLDHPSSRDEHETVGCVRALDDFDGPVALSREGLLEFGAGVSAVGEDVAQPRIGRADRRQDERSAVAILDVGGMDYDADEMALRVGDDVPLATHDLLAGVESARTAAFTGFRGLAVDHAGCRAGLAAILFSRRHDQGVIDRLPTSLVAPGVEIPLHRRIGREILWQLSPLAAGGRGAIQDRVQDIAKLDLPRSSQRRARRQMRGH